MAMGYGGLFEWRIPPIHGQRAARYQLDPAAAAPIPQGSPVKVTATAATLPGVTTVVAAVAADTLVPGKSGIAVREYGPRFGYTRDAVDGLLVGTEALQLIHPGDMVQVIWAEGVKFVLRNGMGSFDIQEAAGAAGGPPSAQTMVDVVNPAIGGPIGPSGTANLTVGPWDATAPTATWATVTEIGTGYIEAVLTGGT